ncbi:2-amino-4-hydroxy-6-hydroxymethyldihydropteridine diphosphokinase [Microbacterium sp. Sa4CUA7]|uniref:2-amino-4-hydroxy-6-hydroxymethyldihydropteridine diphosphokinase n=1 Tax=Microbacterium pullorum TaxID=2762236 RepID=A0ABR8S4J2_9MICO|nr:2-amino-4-hydroxy-6-hydroxymethyldihydropteridine diphosphokinase [Microbacterium pullorum]MBD7958365.1 2-amino-4-hydroxy-6-hydroxymethyldihydropteridine diphosphokinase [Microbacterium pullorum]
MSRRLAQGFSGDASASSAESSIAVVALGANLGARADTIASALRHLARMPLTTEVVAAAPIESVAVTADGPDPQAPGYLNTVALLRTRLAPSVLLGYLHAIEAEHGRAARGKDAVRWLDRTLDLDLIAYDDVRSSDPALLLPHPRAAERDFVLGPWLTIDPDAVLPGRGRVDELLRRLHADAAGAPS